MAFAECRLYLNLPGIEGAYKTKLLQEIALVQGTIVGDPAAATHALFRHRRQPEFAAITSGRENIRICGPLWLVASLQARELLDPDAHALYEPFPDACVPGVAESPHRRLTITGLEGIERLLAQTALISMGCDLCMQYLRMQTSLIVAKDVHDTASKKAQAARDDKTPLVNLNWALDSLERWHVQPLEPYKRNSVVNIVFRPPAAAGPPQAASPLYVEDSEGGEASNQSPAGAHQARAPHAATVGGAGAAEKLLLAGLDHGDDQDMKTKETVHVAKEINDGTHKGVGDDNQSLELFNAGGVVHSLPEGTLPAGTTTQALDNIRGIVDTLCHETQQRSDRAAPVVFHSLRDGMRQRQNDEHEHRNEGLVDASANEVKATKEASPTPSLSALGATGATTAEVLLDMQPEQEAMTRSFDEDRQIDGGVPQTEVVDDADVAASERGSGGATLGVEDKEGDDDDNHDDGVHSPHAIEPEASDAAPAIARNGDAATEQDEGCAAAEGGGTVERRPRKQRGPTRAPFSQPPMDEDMLPVPEQGSKEGVATAGKGKRKRGGAKSSTRVAASGSGHQSRLGNKQHARVVERKEKEKKQAGMQHGGNNIKKPTKESETTAASRGPTAAAAAANSQHPAATNKRTTPAPALEEATTKSLRMNPGAGPAGAGAGAGPSKRTKMVANKPHAADQSENPAAEAVEQAATAETSRKKTAAAEHRGGPSPSDGMRVALSGLHSDQQRDLRAKLASLGIPWSSTDHAWHNNTHIVAPGLLRNQKCLAALACGAWLVGTSFVEASARAGSLVEEGPHELNVASGSRASFEADVASHWRRRQCNTGLKAFSGLRFAVGRQTDGSATREDLCAIIHAGDGSIVSMKEQADIVVVASEAAGARSTLHKSKGALVVTPEYIFKWLTFPHGMLDEHVVSSSTRNAAVIKAERERGDVGGAAADFRTKKQGSARREPSPESSRSL